MLVRIVFVLILSCCVMDMRFLVSCFVEFRLFMNVLLLNFMFRINVLSFLVSFLLRMFVVIKGIEVIVFVMLCNV